MSRESSPGAPWSVVLGLDAPWLDLERISGKCVTERNAIPVLRTALEQFRQAVRDSEYRHDGPAGGVDSRRVDRAKADALELHRNALARIDAHEALQVTATWIPSIGADWMRLRDGDSLIAGDLQWFRDQLDARVAALEASGTAVDSPAFAQARAACLRLHQHGTALLEAHRTLGLRTPWSPEELDLRCSTLEGVSEMRRRCAEFEESVDQEEQRQRDLLGLLPLDLDMAVRRCRSLCEEIRSVIRCHEDEIRGARTSTARTVEEIPPLPPGAIPAVSTFDTAFAAMTPTYELDEPTAQRVAQETMRELDTLYLSGFKSDNKVNLRKGLDAAAQRLSRLAGSGVDRPIHGTPRERMEASRRMPWHNCADLVFAGQGYLGTREPPIAAAHIDFALPGSLGHTVGVLNAAHHLPLDKDMTRWPPDVWVFDRWTGKRAVRARDYPQYFLDQMRKWEASGKLMRGPERRIGDVEFSHWYSALDTRWVEGIVNALRNLPQVAPPPADSLEPWPGSRTDPGG